MLLAYNGLNGSDVKNTNEKQASDKNLLRRAECKSSKGTAYNTEPIETRVPLKIQEPDSSEISSQSTSLQSVTI